MVKKPALTELDWEKVFRARCKSKRGETLSEADQTLVRAAFDADRERYTAMEGDVFRETAPFGSFVRRNER